MSQSRVDFIAEMPRSEILRLSLEFVLAKLDDPRHIPHWDFCADRIIDDLGGMAGAW